MEAKILVVEQRRGEDLFSAIRRTIRAELDTEGRVGRPNPYNPYEGGNTKLPSQKRMTFGEAVECLKRGESLAREGWNGKGMCLKAQFPDAHSKMTFPYLYMTIPDCAEGTRLLPWQPAQVDLFSEDWVVLD